jgi:HEAT repeat protein
MFGLLLVAPLLLADPANGGSWPLWPNAAALDAEPLRPESGAAESRRGAALRALDGYPDALLTEHLLLALEDRSPQIRREALQICARRRLRACLPAARRRWSEAHGDLSSSLYALRLLSAEGTDEAVDRLLGVLRQPNDLIRAEAARLLGFIDLPKGADTRVRLALVAKLSDSAPEVRREIARSIGLRGATEATLVLAHLLDDPDPERRLSAAEALGLLADPRGLPALTRALDRGDEPNVMLELLRAYARFPGPTVDQHLLELLDAPPRGLNTKQLPRVLGERTLSPAAIDAIIRRLREPDLRPLLFATLVLLGDQPIPALRAALERGLEPALAIEVRRLIRARDLSALQPPPAPTYPPDHDSLAWSALLSPSAANPTDPTDPGNPTNLADLGNPALSPAANRLLIAAELGKRAPPWLAALTAGVFETTLAPDRWRPWALALALTAPGDAKDAPSLLLWARLAAAADDPHLDPADRCLALSAFAVAPAKVQRQLGAPQLQRWIRDPHVQIRACAALTLALTATEAHAHALLALLHDPASRVRAAAALALRAYPRSIPPRGRAHLAHLSESDRDPHVRAAARLAYHALEQPHSAPPTLTWYSAPAQRPGWLLLEIDGQSAAAPAFTLAGVTWTLLPGPGVVLLPQQLDPADLELDDIDE